MPNRTANRQVGFRRCRGAPDHVGDPGVSGNHPPGIAWPRKSNGHVTNFAKDLPRHADSPYATKSAAGRGA
jgi:hypothetical protein